MRESPSIKLINLLTSNGAKVDYSDPFVPNIKNLRHTNLKLKSRALSPNVIEKYDLILISTNHDAFDYKMIEKYSKMIVDTEPLTTSWRFFINEDKSRVTMYESFTNWRGLMHHDKRITEGDLKDRLPEVFARYKFEGVTVLGPVTDELKQFFLDIGFDKAMDNSDGKLIEFDYRTSIGSYTKK